MQVTSQPDIISQAALALVKSTSPAGKGGSAATDAKAIQQAIQELPADKVADVLRPKNSAERIRLRAATSLLEQVSNVNQHYATMVYQAVRGPTEGNDGAAVSSDPQVWIAQVLKRASEPLNEITEATSPAKRDQLIGKALVLFFEGIRDDHVSGFTTSNGLARLGFRVNSAVDGDGNRRYSVHFADARRLGPERAAELEHAEVLSIDGQPYAEYVEGRLAGGVPEFISKIDTERVQADGFSTFRVGAFGEEVPKGTVKFEFKLRDGRTVTRDLQWITRDNETPGPGVRPTSGTASGLAPMANTALRELVPRGALNFSPRSPCRGRSISDRKCAALIRRADQAQIPNSDAVGLRNIIAQRKGFTMMNQKQALFGELDRASTDINLHQVGGRRSYLPRLGNVIEEGPEDALFDHYITEIKGKKVGAVRIATYSVDDPDAHVQAFGDIIAKFKEAGCDGLFVDQVKNPGGSVPYLYALYSHFSSNSLDTPLHMSRVSREDAASARATLTLIDELEGELSAAGMGPHEVAVALLGETFGGYSVSTTVLQNLKNELAHEVQQFEADQGLLGAPFHISAINKIEPNPDPSRVWDGPIGQKVDADTYSGGDFGPAIGKYNDIMDIYGVSGSGAGGFIRSFAGETDGLASYSLTGSVALWETPKKGVSRFIEGRGVDIDTPIEPTWRDIKRQQYSDMKRKLEDAMLETIERFNAKRS